MLSPHRNAGDLGDGLHLLDAADADLGDPECAADVRPLLAALGGLHGAAAVGAELALGLRAERAGAAEPLAGRPSALARGLRKLRDRQGPARLKAATLT